MVVAPIFAAVFLPGIWYEIIKKIQDIIRKDLAKKKNSFRQMKMFSPRSSLTQTKRWSNSILHFQIHFMATFYDAHL